MKTAAATSREWSYNVRLLVLYTASQKNLPESCADIFAKCESIFEILLLTHLWTIQLNTTIRHSAVSAHL